MVNRADLTPRLMLPCGVLLRIAQFVPDFDSFYAVLVACQDTTSDQGLFKAMWHLSRTIHPLNVWPSLELYSMDHYEWELAIQAMPAYETVNMYARDDLHRLVGRVLPSVNLVVVHDEKVFPMRMRKWFGQLARLPVRGLVFMTGKFADRMPRVIPHLLNVWPSLKYLRCLKLTVGDQDSLESICKCVASSQITNLRLEGQRTVDGYSPRGPPHITLDGKLWANLAAWLQSTPVTVFELYMFRIVCDDDETTQALNGALAASKAMRAIFWWHCAIRISAPLAPPPNLLQLSLPSCTFELVGIERTLKLLPNLPFLNYLTLNGMPLSPSNVDTLASVLVHTKVSSLHLNDCSIGGGGRDNGCIQRLAGAFEATATLRLLFLANNSLGFDGVKVFLAAVERRAFVTKFVGLSGNCPQDRVGELQDLVNTRMPPNASILV